MPVSTPNKSYTENLPKWQIVRDCDEGSTAVKKKGVTYLPQPNPTDKSAENTARYDDYRNRANFVNFVASTKEGLLGMVFRKETKLELDSSIDYLKDNIDGNGLSTDQMIKDVSGDVLLTGRYGLLADYPPAPSGLTQAQVLEAGLGATIKPYPTESVLSWRTHTFGGISKNVSIVLVEPTEKATEDPFVFECVDYHRHLLLKDMDGKLTYVQNLYNEDDELILWDTGEVVKGEKVFEADIIPRKSDGSTWDEITFQFIGADNNDSTVDKAPLYDIAEINISHYQNSADFEESSFMVGQPTPFFSGFTQTWVDKNMKDGIGLGSRGGVVGPEGSDGKLLQADPNQMPEKGMERKEQQMVMIGARLIQDSTGNETAEAARIRFGGQNSKVASVVINVENGFIKCFDWALEFMGGTQESEVEINKELFDRTLDPQMVMAQIQLMDRGVIAKPDVQDNLRAAGLIKQERTNEEIDAEAEENIMNGDFGLPE